MVTDDAGNVIDYYGNIIGRVPVLTLGSGQLLQGAGTIGAATDNGAGVAGVNWNARIVPVRVLGKGGGTDLDIAAGMTWATGGTVPGMAANANPAKVVSMSLGGQGEAQLAVQ